MNRGRNPGPLDDLQRPSPPSTPAGPHPTPDANDEWTASRVRPKGSARVACTPATRPLDVYRLKDPVNGDLCCCFSNRLDAIQKGHIPFLGVSGG